MPLKLTRTETGRVLTGASGSFSFDCFTKSYRLLFSQFEDQFLPHPARTPTPEPFNVQPHFAKFGQKSQEVEVRVPRVNKQIPLATTAIKPSMRSRPGSIAFSCCILQPRQSKSTISEHPVRSCGNRKPAGINQTPTCPAIRW